MIFIVILTLTSLFGGSYAGSSAYCEPYESDFLEVYQLFEKVLEGKKASLLGALAIVKYSPASIIEAANIDFNLFPELFANISSTKCHHPPPVVLQVMREEITAPEPLDCVVGILISINVLIQKTLKEIIDEATKQEKIVTDLTNLTCPETLEWFKAIDASIKNATQARAQFLQYQTMSFIHYAPFYYEYISSTVAASAKNPPSFTLLGDAIGVSSDSIALLFKDDSAVSSKVLECLKEEIKRVFGDIYKILGDVVENARKLAQGC